MSGAWVAATLLLGCSGDPDGMTTADSSDMTTSGSTTGQETTSTTGPTTGLTTGVSTDGGTGTGGSTSGSTTNPTTGSSTGVDLCGNGAVDGDEVCDDGVNDGAYGGCMPDCSALGPSCGDGVMNGPEGCDDGNTEDADACTNACVPASCGDGIIQAPEACDDGNMDDTDACLNSCAAASCGDGVIQAGVEECDDANDVDTDDCLSTCAAAKCGDSVVQAGVETCDDGVNDNAYGGCAVDCKALGPFCGDAVKNGPEVCDDGVNDNAYNGCAMDCSKLGPKCGDSIKNGPEGCDDGNMVQTDGCLTTCAVPKTCLEIKTAVPAATDGLYTVTPTNIQPFKVWCDMTTNGGGYSFLKIVGGQAFNAVQAEAECDKYGMNLLITRTPEHVVSSYKVATNAMVPPGADTNFIYIMGIYPKVKGDTCVNKAFASATPMCNWRAGDNGPFYVGNKVNIAEPNGDNDINASMYYTFDVNGVVTGYNDITFPGYTSLRIMCDFGDKKM